MSGKKSELGPTGNATRANIRRHRENQGLSFAALSRELGDIGRPIAPLGLRRIEDGERRVDADDLVAIAVALKVNPNALLLPATPDADGRFEVTGARGLDEDQLLAWANGAKRLTYDPMTMPDRLVDDTGKEITPGSVAFGKVLFAQRFTQQEAQDQEFARRVRSRG